MRRCLANAWKPHYAAQPQDWVPSRVRLDNTIEAGAGKFDISRRPWWKEILADIFDAEVQSISIKAATQVGKTLALVSLILWCAENAPAPAMLVVPDQDAAVEMRDRVYATARATIAAGGTSRLRVPPDHKWNLRYIHLGSMRIHLAWSGSRQRLRGKPCRYVFLTETDVYGANKKAGDPIAAAHQRTKAFFRGLWYHESSPSSTLERPSEISQLEEQAAARYRWCCPCPKCGHVQEMRFFTREVILPGQEEPSAVAGIAGMKNAHGEWYTVEEARKHAFYVCEKGCRIENDQKQAMLENGEWKTIDGRKPQSRRSVGRHLWSIHSESITFGDLAAEYLKHREEGKIPEYFGNWLGLEYKPQKRQWKWSALGHRLAGAHPRGTVPPEAWFLTAGADVQGENRGVRYVIRAWGPAQTSWLVDWGWIDRTPGDENELVKSDIQQLGDLVLGRYYPVHGGATNAWGKRELRVRLLNIDTGHLPMKVHHWLKSLPEEWTDQERGRVRAIRGDHQVKPELRWRYNVLETNTRTGEKYEGGMGQWGIYVYPFYDELLERLAGEPGRPGSFHFTSDTLTQGRSYLEQVSNFSPKTEIDPKTGQRKLTWGPVNGRIEVDYWDCEIYAQVAAAMVIGDMGWSAEAFEKWRDAHKGSRQTQAEQLRRQSSVDMLDDR